CYNTLPKRTRLPGRIGAGGGPWGPPPGPFLRGNDGHTNLTSPPASDGLPRGRRAGRRLSPARRRTRLGECRRTPRAAAVQTSSRAGLPRQRDLAVLDGVSPAAPPRVGCRPARVREKAGEGRRPRPG